MAVDERLATIESALIGIRGYVSRPPEIDEAVVLLFSGGVDSVVAAAQLAESTRAIVHLLFVNRGQTNLDQEWAAAHHYATMLSERYGTRVRSLTTVECPIPPVGLRDSVQAYSTRYGYPCRDNLFAIAGMYYGASVGEDYGVIKHIYVASLDQDGYPHCSLIALRATTLMACVSTPFDDWSITSPHSDPFVAPLGVQTKAALISWAESRGLSLGRTRTCQSAGANNCGVCSLCRVRRRAFEEAGADDLSTYGAIG